MDRVSDLLLVAALIGAIGCKGGADDVATTPSYDTHPLAAGAVLEKVSFLQGVEKVLYEVPGTFSGGRVPPPVIQGRDAMLRVYVAPGDGFTPREIAVVASVTSGGQPIVLDQVATLEGGWDLADLDSTFNFPIPAEFVSADLQLDVSIHEITPAPAAGAGTPVPEDLVWSSATEGLDTAPTDVVELVIIPVKYDADGSGRLPDTSPATVAQIAATMTAMYPATEVVVTVGDPLPWSSTISGFDFGAWSQLLDRISQMRSNADVPANTYYYGLFDSEPSFNDFCGFGCILGLSLLSPNPADNWARASIGVGYPSEAVPTLLHEVGHAHGREHAPCNLYGQASDPGYPYANAQLGSLGYDIITKQIVSPTAAADVMSYCSPQWVSDYTFTALHQRTQALIDRRDAQPTATMQALRIDGDGNAQFGSLLQASPSSGEPVQIELLDAAGAVLEVVDGGFVPYDHVPGGMAVIAPPRRAAASARVRSDVPLGPVDPLLVPAPAGSATR